MRRRDERGVAAFWVIFLAIGTLALGGLVIDGGYVMAAKREAARTAEQAARVASDQLDLDSVRTGGSDVNASAAAGAAQSFIASAGESGTVAINGDEVTVTVTKRHKAILLSAFGPQASPSALPRPRRRSTARQYRIRKSVPVCPRSDVS